LALVFLVGLLNQSYWALAIPVAILGFFALGLAAWVGFTIATIRVDAETPIPATADEVNSDTSGNGS
jgi:TRAP-type C4-dicarboxylate transport system permease small subunit